MSPSRDEALRPGIGLALSGGGFRATLFHCGAFWRLNELAYLPSLDLVSSVSGGSIVAGRLALRWHALVFEDGVATNLREEVIAPVQRFCERCIDLPAIIKGIALPGVRISDALRCQYEKHLLGTATLQDLPDRPQFIFSSANMATGVSFRLCKPYAADYRIGMIERPRFRLSLAVTASTAFPPFLSPVIVRVDPSAFRPTQGADLYSERHAHRRLVLTDGGAYDNLGLETVWKLQTALVSDAGAPFAFASSPAVNWFSQTRRVLDITVNQARALRKRWLIARLQGAEQRGAYWGIMSEIGGYHLPDALPVPDDVPARLAKIRTRLAPFSPAEQAHLINWGYAIADAAMRRYVVAGPAPRPRWPYPAAALARPLPADVKIVATRTDLPDPREAPSPTPLGPRRGD